MTQYYIQETQDVHSKREGTHKKFKTLTQAKIYARKNQAFEGTCLKISIAGTIVCYTDENDKWVGV